MVNEEVKCSPSGLSDTQSATGIRRHVVVHIQDQRVYSIFKTTTNTSG